MGRKSADDFMDDAQIASGVCYVQPGVVCKNHFSGSCRGDPNNYDPYTYVWNGPSRLRYGGIDKEDEVKRKNAAREAVMCSECFVHARRIDSMRQGHEEENNKSNLDMPLQPSVISTKLDTAFEDDAGHSQVQSNRLAPAIKLAKDESTTRVSFGQLGAPVSRRSYSLSGGEGAQNDSATLPSTVASQQHVTLTAGHSTPAVSVKRKREDDSRVGHTLPKSARVENQGLRGILVKPEAAELRALKVVRFFGTSPVDIVKSTQEDSIASVDEAKSKLNTIIKGIYNENARGLARKNHTQPRLLTAKVSLRVTLHRRERIMETIEGVTIWEGIYDPMLKHSDTLAGVDRSIKYYDDIVQQCGAYLESRRRANDMDFHGSDLKKWLMAHINAAYNCKLTLLQRAIKLVQS